jgi:2-succinyl-5-enolpyruvyl-6-hydroxy-3-cyclohexene-1-carboxylate synthase
MDFKKTISKEILDALYSSNVVVLSEALGNISDSKSIKNFDEVLHKYQDHLKPDLVITFGLGMVSKRIRLYIKSLQNVVHWHIDESGEAIDTYRKLSKVWEIHPNQFLQTFTNKLTANKEYFDLWNQYSETIEKLSSIFDSGSEFSDYKAIKKIIENLPSNAQLHAGNSTPIRYVNLFASKIPSSIKVLSNRGTSGIDGCTSTASGAQYLSSKMNVLILGDLSFHYDINGLWNHYLNPKFRIVMINNEGGNIFRLIDGPKRTGNLEEFFETTYRYDAKFLAAHFGLEYYICTNEVELEQILSDFWKMSDKPKLLEVKTGNKSSEEVFKKYFNYIKQ